MRRRQVLRTSGYFGIGLSAGCLSNNTRKYAPMQKLSFVNPESNYIFAELRINRADSNKTVYTETYELSGDSDWVILDCTWPDAPLILMARPKNGEWNEFTTKDMDGCVGVIIEVHDQKVEYFDQNVECPIDDPRCHTE